MKFEELTRAMNDSLTDGISRAMLPMWISQILPKSIVESTLMVILIKHFAWAIMRALDQGKEDEG